MSAILRAKMRVTSVLQSKDAHGGTEQEIVKLTAVTSHDGTANAEWAKWTPSANFEIYINNPAAHGHLSKGHEYYVDFTPVTDEVG